MKPSGKDIKPVISVIVPVWNEEAALPACLASLTNQRTKIPYEVIVVDKQSTDKSRSIAASYPVRLITEKRPGRAHARNAGLRVAKGTIIALTEADCIVPATWISNIADYMHTHPDIVGLAGPSMFFRANPLTRIGLHLIIYSSSIMYQLFSGTNTIRGQNSAFRTSVLTKSGIFRPDIAPCDDLEFGFRAGKFGPIHYVPTIAVETSNRRIQGRLPQFLFEYWSSVIRLFILKKTGDESWYPSVR